MKILLTTQEGWLKDQKPATRKARENRLINFTFTGNDAPVKTVRALMEKYGITKDEL